MPPGQWCRLSAIPKPKAPCPARCAPPASRVGSEVFSLWVFLWVFLSISRVSPRVSRCSSPPPPPIHHLPVGMFPAPPRGAAFGMLGTCASLKLRGWGRTHRAPPAFWTARSSVPCRCPVGTRRHGCPLPQPRCGAASEEISVRSVEAARCRWRRPCGAEWSCRGSHAGAVQE